MKLTCTSLYELLLPNSKRLHVSALPKNSKAMRRLKIINKSIESRVPKVNNKTNQSHTPHATYCINGNEVGLKSSQGLLRANLGTFYTWSQAIHEALRRAKQKSLNVIDTFEIFQN